MKKAYLLILLLPALVFAQNKSKSKPAHTTATETAKSTPVKPSDGFMIRGFIKGFPEGTTVALLNGQTGAPEAETKIVKNAFSFAGKVITPDFKVILFDKKPPYIALFLDNSAVTIKGVKDSIEYAVIEGSPSNTDYVKLSLLLEPYQKVFGENAVDDPAAIREAMQVSADFVKQNSGSFIAPLAIMRYSQLAEETSNTEALFALLSPEVKGSWMGNAVAKQLSDGRRNAIGTIMADFTQADTSGKPVSLNSYRGKYVLIDFWASWCRPCRQENPNVVANYDKFKDKNFTVLGVSLDQTKPAWINAIQMDGLVWQHVSDLQGWTNSVAQQFQVTSIPQNFLIDPNGKIIAKNLRGPALEKKLAALLK